MLRAADPLARLAARVPLVAIHELGGTAPRRAAGRAPGGAPLLPFLAPPIRQGTRERRARASPGAARQQLNGIGQGERFGPPDRTAPAIAVTDPQSPARESSKCHVSLVRIVM